MFRFVLHRPEKVSVSTQTDPLPPVAGRADRSTETDPALCTECRIARLREFLHLPVRRQAAAPSTDFHAVRRAQRDELDRSLRTPGGAYMGHVNHDADLLRFTLGMGGPRRPGVARRPLLPPPPSASSDTLDLLDYRGSRTAE